MLTTVVQCSHCKADLNPDGTCPNGGRHLYTQATRTKAACPLCGGPLHHNDAQVVMDFRCAWRQFSANSGAKELDLTPSHVQEFAAWFTQAPRRYGATLAAQELAAAGATFKVVEKATKGKGNAASAAALPVPQPQHPDCLQCGAPVQVGTIPAITGHCSEACASATTATLYPPPTARAATAPPQCTYCYEPVASGLFAVCTYHATVCVACLNGTHSNCSEPASVCACTCTAQAPAPVVAAPAEIKVDAHEIMAALKRELRG